MKGGLGEIMGRMGGQPSAGGMQIPRPPAGRSMPLPQRQAVPAGGGANDVLFPHRGGQSGGWDRGRADNDSGVRTNSEGGLEMPDGTSRPGGMDTGMGPSMGPNIGGGQRGPGANGQPLPMPGQQIPGLPGNADNPYGDLADILRRGLGLPGGGGPATSRNPGGGNQGRGQSGDPLPMPGGQGGPLPRGGGIELPGGKVGGGMLWNIVRSILGGAMGFQSKGIISWLIRMVFMRYGWTILRTILGRGLFGR
jgi:hypothetical protein